MEDEPLVVQALYAFKGANNDELRFKKGDLITVTRREEGGWWEGTLGETTGWFPADYVRERRDASPGVGTEGARLAHEVLAFRQQVVADVVDSERAHVAELRRLVDGFLRPLQKTLAPDEYDQLVGNALDVVAEHEELLAHLEEEAARPPTDQRVGSLFLQRAPRLDAVHRVYCANHPKAVVVLDRRKDELNAFMERHGAVSPGILVLTTGLSKPFRRLQKYAAMLQELGRHVLESHPDRGDTLRAVAVYKDIASSCAAVRRQKELELQVVTGAVRGWRGSGGTKDVASLGEVLHMGSVALGETHADRYFVLFPSTLLILSVSRRMSAFVYEGCLPLSGIQVVKLEDTDTRKNAFEISGTLIDTVVAVCQSNTEAEKWISLLTKHSNTLCTASTYSSLPHSPIKMSPTETTTSTPVVQSSHKRSHSFNNHHSYTYYVQQQKQKDKMNEKCVWIQSSCDTLSSQNMTPIHSSVTSTSLFASDYPETNSSFQGWSIKNLRPPPPLRPFANADINDDASGTNINPYGTMQRKINSYEEDALILRVIEAYCTSARSCSIANSEWEEDLLIKNATDCLVRSPSLPLHYAPRNSNLWPKVLHLEADIKILKEGLKQLKTALEEERQERILSLAALQPVLCDAKESKC